REPEVGAPDLERAVDRAVEAHLAVSLQSGQVAAELAADERGPADAGFDAVAREVRGVAEERPAQRLERVDAERDLELAPLGGVESDVTPCLQAADRTLDGEGVDAQQPVGDAQPRTATSHLDRPGPTGIHLD